MFRVAALLARPSIPLLRQAIYCRVTELEKEKIQNKLKSIPNVVDVRLSRNGLGVIANFEDSTKANSAIELLKNEGNDAFLLHKDETVKRGRDSVTITRLLRGSNEVEILAKLKEFGKVKQFFYGGGTIARVVFENPDDAKKATLILNKDLFLGRQIEAELQLLDNEEKKIVLLGASLEDAQELKNQLLTNFGLRSLIIGKRTFNLLFQTFESAEKAIEILKTNKTIIEKSIRVFQKRATNFVKISNVPLNFSEEDFLKQFDFSGVVDRIESVDNPNFRTIFLSTRTKNDAIRIHSKLTQTFLINGHRIRVDYYKPKQQQQQQQ